MKKLWVILLAFWAIVFTSCGLKTGAPSSIIATTGAPSDESPVNTADKATYITMHADWPVYDSAESVVERADMVFIGKVSDVSFRILDETTGLPPTSDAEDHHRQLFTFYDIDVLTSYKGNTEPSVQMAIRGGIKGYHVQEQLDLVKSAQGDGIPIMEDMPEIEISVAYLFAVEKTDGLPTYPINANQSIYSLYDPFDKNIIGSYALDNPAEYYSKKTDQYESPIISAKDVISAFGKEKWDAFWMQWKRENPNWQDRLDATIVEKALAEN